MRPYHKGLLAVAVLAVLAVPALASDIHLNEIYASHTGTDDQEFIELLGTPGMSLDYHMVLVVEGDGPAAGTLDRAWALTGLWVPGDGLFVLGDTAVPGIDFSLGSDNNIENGTETVYLVDAVDQAGVDAILALIGTDTDPEDDGTTVLPGMAMVLDIIGMVDDDYPATDVVYDGADVRGPDGTFFPAGIFRSADWPRDWSRMWLDFSLGGDLPRTPGAPNTVAPTLNEVYASHAGTDDQEFVEIVATPDIALDYLMVLVVEGDGAAAGTLDRAWALTGLTMPADGYFVLGDTAVPNLDLDVGADNTIENGTETIYMVDAHDQAGVDAITALLGTDVDPEDDGTTVLPDMAAVLDIIAMIDDDYPATDVVYDGSDTRGPDGSFLPAGIFRDLDFTRDWSTMFLDYDDTANADFPRTPGAANSFGPRLNEIYASHSGTDDNEHIELVGTGGVSLDYLMVLIVEGDGPAAGTLDDAWALTGFTMPTDGYFVLGNTAVPNLDFDIGSDNAIENGTETFYLVDAADQAGVDAITALLGTDTDPEDDGTTVLPGMATVLDIIAMIDSDYPDTDVVYDGADVRGPDGSYFPAGIFRNGNYPNDWDGKFLDFSDTSNLILPRTPGESNITNQRDIGFAGPGSAQFYIFGEPMGPGVIDTLAVIGATPDSVAYVVSSVTFNPLPFAGGMLVPFPPFLLAPFATDSNGDLVIPLRPNPPGIGPLLAYSQVVYDDPAQPVGVGITNVLAVDLVE